MPDHLTLDFEDCSLNQDFFGRVLIDNKGNNAFLDRHHEHNETQLLHAEVK